MPTIKTEQEMIALGRELGSSLTPPATIELIGDVGAGKTTLVKGIAAALDIPEPITSPSFTLSKTYLSKHLSKLSKSGAWNSQKHGIILRHYDFYRLLDPGILAEDLAESISDPSTITIIEWAETVADILPTHHTRITITYQADGSRQVEISQ